LVLPSDSLGKNSLVDVLLVKGRDLDIGVLDFEFIFGKDIAGDSFNLPELTEFSLGIKTSKIKQSGP